MLDQAGVHVDDPADLLTSLVADGTVDQPGEGDNRLLDCTRRREAAMALIKTGAKSLRALEGRTAGHGPPSTDRAP